MASIFIEFQIADSLKDYFKTAELDPFTPLVLSIKVDRDKTTLLVQEVLQEVRYQKQRDDETFKELDKTSGV